MPVRRPLRGVLAVASREFLIWRRSYKLLLTMQGLQGLVYVVTFGVALGAYLKGGFTDDYLAFLAVGLVPAFLAQNAAGHSLFGVWTNLHERTAYETIVTTTTSVRQLWVAQMVWHSLHATLNACVVLLVLLPFRVLSVETVLLMPLVMLVAAPSLVLPAMAWGAHFTGFEKANLYFGVVQSPMFFLSGIFFPVEALPPGLRQAVFLSPLYHTTEIVRSIQSGDVGWALGGHLAFLVAVVAALTFLVDRTFTRHLGK